MFIVNVILLLVMNSYVMLTPDKLTRYVFDVSWSITHLVGLQGIYTVT